jgi:hypothetical protein
VTREAALAREREHLDNGAFLGDLALRVAVRSASQEADAGPALHGHLADEIGPALAALGFTCRIHPNPEPA